MQTSLKLEVALKNPCQGHTCKVAPWLWDGCLELLELIRDYDGNYGLLRPY